MKNILASLLTLFFVQHAFTNEVKLHGNLSNNKKISSDILGYVLQYRVYTPPNYENLTNLPVIFLTDGQWYLESGRMHEEIDKQISSGKIKPIVAVFVDNRAPENLSNNRRNSQFLGNGKYVDFYKNELIPALEKSHKVSNRQEDRAIMGMSFGGLNATYFGVMASDKFHMLGIQSPALHPVPGIHDMYSNQGRLPLKIFLSTGTVNDTAEHARKLKKTLDTKGYQLKYIEVPEGHNWQNWKPLLDDALIYFFGI
ncbi:MAG: esterase family protein [Cytophagales bacterium]|nr:esterase family protein [Cytophagales bacterium]